MDRLGHQRPLRWSRKEKWLYALAFGVIAVMLYVVGFPIFILLFVGVLAFFIWKAFTSVADNDTKAIFDFYLSANEILGDDARRWYGFEVTDTIAKGEAVVGRMTTVPPLVLFTLGSLYARAGDHASAVKYIEKVCGDDSVDEMSIADPTKELREYARILRKIERSPEEAPLTSSAVRSLERLRQTRGAEMLQELREGRLGEPSSPEIAPKTILSQLAEGEDIGSKIETKGDRSTISEVLHDIYDTNIQ